MVLKSTSRRPTTRRTTALDHLHRPERFTELWPAAVALQQLRRRPDQIPACRKARHSKRSGRSGLRATQGPLIRPDEDLGAACAYQNIARTGRVRAASVRSLTTWTAAGATPSAASYDAQVPPPRRTTHTNPPTHATSPWRSRATHRHHR